MFILLAFSVFLQQTLCEDKLKQIIVVSRHGIRGPQQPVNYGGTPATKCHLLDLNGHVTIIGHQQNYALGDYLKGAYTSANKEGRSGDFTDLSLSQYNSQKHIFYAPDVEKDLMSGNSVSQGLFDTYFSTPTGYDATPTIPVHIAPDHVLKPEDTTVSCGTVITQTEQAILKSDVSQSSKIYKDCYEGIQDKSKIDKDKVNLTLLTAPRFAEQNILTVGNLMYMSQEGTETGKKYVLDEAVNSGWTERVTNGPITALTIDGTSYSYDELFKYCTYDGYATAFDSAKKPWTCSVKIGDTAQSYTYSELVIHMATRRQQLLNDPQYVEYAQLKTTPFIRHVNKQMHALISQSSTYSFIFYLGENGNVQNLLQLLNQRVPGRVPFGSSITFELWHNASATTAEKDPKSYYVKVLYRRFSNNSFTIQNLGSDDKPITKKYIDLTSAVCGKDECAVDDMLNLVMTEDAWRTKCNINDAQYYSEELQKSEAALSDTENDKDKYYKLFIIFLIVLLVLLVICIVIIVLQCICCRGSSSSSSKESSYEETVADPPQ